MFTTDILNRVFKELGLTCEFEPGVIGKCVIDSRLAEKNDIFVAFEGEKIDAHEFVPELIQKGVFCVGTKSLNFKNYARVDNCTDFLIKLAKELRTISTRKVIAVTGSSGKTTTREFIAAMLKFSGFQVYSTSGNLNNDLGLPITMINTPIYSTHEVFELGMNHSGEIKLLAETSKPDFGVITNIGFAHIGNFNSRDELADAKLELFDFEKTIPILNVEDSYALKWLEKNRGREVITYSILPSSAKADFKVISRESGKINASWKNNFYFWELPEIPEYMEDNFLTAAAVALALNSNPNKFEKALLSANIPKMRGEIIKIGERIIKSDCYNANPDSMRRSIEGFIKIYEKENSDMVLVLGEMKELGKFSDLFHQEVVDFVKSFKNIKKVILIGELYKKAFSSVEHIPYFNWVLDASEAVKFIPEKCTLLLKGSRSAKLERIIDILINIENQEKK